jgi:hypothetical protein
MILRLMSLCSLLSAQATLTTSTGTVPLSNLPEPVITFSSQGAAVLGASVGKALRGVQILEVVICSPTPIRFSGGLVYQEAVRNAISTIGPSEAKLVLRRTANLSPWNLSVEGITDADSAWAVVSAAKGVKLKPSEEAMVLTSALVLNIIKARLKSLSPDPAPVLEALIAPDKDLNLVAGPGCIDGRIVARYRKGMKDPLGPFPLRL